MARIDDMVVDVMGSAYGAPKVVVTRALRRGVRELFKQTQCWREQLDPIESVAGVQQYDIELPYESLAERVLWVRYGGRQLRFAKRPEDLRMLNPESQGAPNTWAQEGQSLLLWPVPADDRIPIVVMAALSVVPDAVEVPDEFHDDYREGIVAWAKHHLLTTNPNAQWFNPELGMMQLEIANQVFNRAKRAQHSGHSTLLSVQPRKFV